MNVNTAAARQGRRAQGHQHGDQQGPHRPDHQQPRAARQPAAAAVDAGLCRRTTRATPTTSRAPRRCSRRPGLPDGFTTELYVYNTDPNPRIAQAIQQDLAAIGITAEIKSLAQANVIEAGGNGSAPMIWSGGMALDRGLPRSLQLLRPDPRLRRRGEGGWNWSQVLQRGRSTPQASRPTR